MRKQGIVIGMFDSGVGGLSILREVHRKIPTAEIHYFADQRFSPYGNKAQEFLIERSSIISHELIGRGAQLIVVACNTATAAAISSLRASFEIPFVGVEPYLNICHQQSEIRPEKVVILTTPSTSLSLKYQSLKMKLDPDNRMTSYTCERLAQFIEDYYCSPEPKDYNRFICAVYAELDPIRERGFTHCILGCTHYPLISSIIEDYLDVQCISTAPFVANRVDSLLPEHPKTQAMSDFYFRSSVFEEWEARSCDSIYEIILRKS